MYLECVFDKFIITFENNNLSASTSCFDMWKNNLLSRGSWLIYTTRLQIYYWATNITTITTVDVSNITTITTVDVSNKTLFTVAW